MAEFSIQIAKIRIGDLVPHEGVVKEHLDALTNELRKDGFQLRPVAVSSLDFLGAEWKDKFLINDGHHRVEALKNLGCTRIMCSIFDFEDPRIQVFDHKDTSIPIRKVEVIERATSGVELTPWYDRHYIKIGKTLSPFHDNDVLEPVCPTPLSTLL